MLGFTHSPEGHGCEAVELHLILLKSRKRYKLKEIDFSAVDNIISNIGTKPESAIPILQEVQSAFGYLPESVIEHIAKSTQITSTQVYGVATFFKQFRLQPVGKHIIKVCHGTACHVGGAERISQAISEELKIKDGQTTKDLKFTLEQVACLGCCSLAPVMMIDDIVYGRLTSSSAVKVLKKYD